MSISTPDSLIVVVCVCFFFVVFDVLFLLHLSCESVVTFVRRCFHDENYHYYFAAEAEQIRKLPFTN